MRIIPRNDEKALCCALLALVIAGCGGGGGNTTDSTSSTTGNDSDDTDDQPTGDPIPPDPVNGNNCGEVLGFKTRCYVDGAYILWFHEDNEEIAHAITDIVGAGDGSIFEGACCEGLADQEEADADCARVCQRLACEAARSNHLDLAEGAAGFGNGCWAWDTNCGFDMEDCLSGTWHEQTIDLVFGNPTYWMQAVCTNTFTDMLFTSDVFNWHELPLNDPANDPGMCDNRPDAELLPGVVNPDDIAIEAAGMTAAVTWTLAGSTYTEDSQDAELRFAYDLHDCPTHARCVDLAALEIKLPAISIQGISIQNATLSIYQVDTQPALQSSGAFSYGPGTLHAIMSASADGIPIMLQGSNTGTATGLLAPASGSMTLSGLQFDYSDSVIAASLQVDIVAEYTERGPTAVIVPQVVPRDCLDPVTFRAASSDPDAQSLTHYWWVPGVLTETGSTLDVVLPAGTHTIGLVSQDTNGRMDAGAIQYTRTCL